MYVDNIRLDTIRPIKILILSMFGVTLYNTLCHIIEYYSHIITIFIF